ncbi:MAG: aminoglycoside phosphotransferase family protein [Thermomicrobiales bacterium]
MKIEPDRWRGTAMRDLLEAHFDSVADVQPLSGGLFSRAYAFLAGGREYVIRINAEEHAAESFAKDDYAWRHFASEELPIPRVVAVGEHEDWHYAISERAPGRTLMECSPEERRAALPALLDTLEAIGKVNTRASTGYGDWGGDGNGGYGSWQEFLAAIIENHDAGYFANWHRYFEDSFLERDVFERVYERMLRLAERCPNMRKLVHNDYQFENVLADGERISGVIDWANALYGDPLYDVAWLGWISTHPGWWFDEGMEILRARFGDAPDFDVRIACCELHIGLDHFRFYARNDRYDDYRLCRDWLLARIGHGPG